MGIFLAIGYTVVLMLLMRRMPFYARIPGISLPLLNSIFLLKIAAGTVLWAIYTWLYPDRSMADVFKYFDDSAIMFGALKDHPGDYFKMLFGIQNDSQHFSDLYYSQMNNWFRKFESNLYNDSHTVIRFNALIRLISFGEFHVHTVFAAFLSLTGHIGIYRAFVAYLGGKERALMIAVFLLPSVLLWGSGVIKESLLFFGLGMLIYTLFNWMKARIGPSGIAALIISGLLLFFLKFYVLLSLFPAIVLFGWASRTTRPPLWVQCMIVYGACLMLALSAPYIVQGLDLLQIITYKQLDFIGLVGEVGSGSFVMPPLLEPNLLSFISLSPYALYITFVGPMIYSPLSAMGVLSILENVCFLAFFILCLRYGSFKNQAPRGMVLSLFLYIILLSFVIGWTTPVMGALVRYRTPLLPFLMIAGLLLLDTEKLYRKLPWCKHIIST